ncbi:MAG: DUF5723 family protein [Bacteroidia bacterium]
MKKFLIFFLIAGNGLIAQFNNDFLFYSNYKRNISANAEYEINSNSINNAFIDKFYFGGYIDSTMKNNVSEKLSGYNRIGGHANLNMVSFFGKDSSSISFLVGLKEQKIFNANFSSDFFKLGFYGNKRYQGETANLSNTNINYYSFQELKFGMVWDNVDTTGASMGIAISYLKGQNMFQLRTNNTSLYTAPDVSQVSLTTKASLAFSDTVHTGPDAINGNGLSAEFFVETPYVSKLGKSKFFVSVNNLGFIRWNKNTRNYAADSTFTWSGIKVDNLFSIKDSTIKSIQSDSILNNSTEYSRHYVSTNLPTSLLILHKIQFNRSFTLTNGFRHMFNGNYKPYIFIETEFTFNKIFSSNLHIGYGGYGRFNSGLSVACKLADRFIIRAGSNSIQGFIVPESTLGQGAYFSLTYKIKYSPKDKK